MSTTPQTRDAATPFAPGSLGIDDGRPVLRADAQVWAADGDAAIRCGADLYRFEGITAAALGRLAGVLDGRPAGEAADAARLDPDTALATIRALDACGLVHPADGAEDGTPVAAETVAAACRRLFPGWKTALFGHDLWTGLTGGGLPRRVFEGWVIETYHFIDGANARMTEAIAACEDPAVRRLLHHHYAEEYDHAAFFARSLDALGMSVADVERAGPLPGTRAVIGWMRRCGRTDPLMYATCSGFLESTGEDRTAARRFFDAVAAAYDSGGDPGGDSGGDSRGGPGVETPAGPVVGPMAEHVTLDEDYGHGALMEQVCAAVGPVSRRRADRAVGAALTRVETLALWSTDILRHYGRPGAPDPAAPRVYRPVDGREASS